MLDGYRFRLYLNPEQQQTLLRWIGCQRLIYNAKVQEDRYFRRFQRRMVGTAGEKVPVDRFNTLILDNTRTTRPGASPGTISRARARGLWPGPIHEEFRNLALGCIGEYMCLN